MTRRIFKLTDHVDHPGTLLRKQYLPALGIENAQASRLANLMQVKTKEISPVLKGKAPVTEKLAQELGRVFNTSPRFWLLLQYIYDESENGSYNTHKKSADRESLQGEISGGSSTQPTVRPRRV